MCLNRKVYPRRVSKKFCETVEGIYEVLTVSLPNLYVVDVSRGVHRPFRVHIQNVKKAPCERIESETPIVEEKPTEIEPKSEVNTDKNLDVHQLSTPKAATSDFSVKKAESNLQISTPQVVPPSPVVERPRPKPVSPPVQHQYNLRTRKPTQLPLGAAIPSFQVISQIAEAFRRCSPAESPQCSKSGGNRMAE